MINIQTIISAGALELQKCGIKSSQLDAKILLKHVLNENDLFLIKNSQKPLSNADYQKFRRFLRRRKSGEPISYITKSKEFFGNNFYINKNVLIPRPETELLIEHCTEFIHSHTFDKNPLNILEIGTGSGCIIISLAKELNEIKYSKNNFNFFATDISKKAITVAKKNAKNILPQTKIKFYNSDLLKNKTLPKKVDIILANLPYVPTNNKKIDYKSLTFEPKNALFADENGFSIYREMFNQISKKYQPKFIGLEIFESHSTKITDLQKKLFDNYKLEFKRDYSSKTRFAILTK